MNTNECSCSSLSNEKKISMDGYATYPVSRKNGSKCSCDENNSSQNTHQTLDFPKTKKYSKRPTILMSDSDCDQNPENIDNTDVKN